MLSTTTPKRYNNWSIGRSIHIYELILVYIITFPIVVVEKHVARACEFLFTLLDFAGKFVFVNIISEAHLVSMSPVEAFRAQVKLKEKANEAQRQFLRYVFHEVGKRGVMNRGGGLKKCHDKNKSVNYLI